MFHIKTRLGASPIHGIGVFAAEFVPKGTLIWSLHRGFDLELDPADILKLPLAAQEQLEHYNYVSPENGKVYLCVDDARFMNHAANPNTHSEGGHGEEGVTVASRDIQVGEELTCDYLEFDAASQAKLKQEKGGK